MVDRYIKADSALVMRDGEMVPVARGYRDLLEERLSEL
jgi:hypothetical protein